MAQEVGRMSIDSENIFPILKRWLYTDRDIFVRELVSNGVDAVTKFRRLVSLGEASCDEDESFAIHVEVNKKEGALSFYDNGIGMTAEEVRKYLNTVAFSSAQDFLDKYKADEGASIIGHFGLGFYSAFMVSRQVTVRTQSWQDAPAVLWTCDGETQYTLEELPKEERGTCVTLKLDDESQEFLNASKVKEVLLTYCGFLPYPIVVSELDENGNPVSQAEPAEKKEGEEKAEIPQIKPINDTNPIWVRPASELTDEDYKTFYHKLFTDSEDPLFWIHLNADFPTRIRGVLFFPKINHQMQTLEGRIKLFNNQVFVADNVEEVIPDYLMMLRGVVDCPDLPLNVSRSALQQDKEVQKIPAYIARKVADKLAGLFKNQREDYDRYWPDIRVFVEYACLKDEKFYDRAKEAIVYPLAGGGTTTLEDYLEKAKGKHDNKVYYASHEQGQATVLTLFKDKGLQALVMDSPLDPAFINFIEEKNTDVKFARVDAELPDVLKAEGQVDLSDQTALEEALKKATGKEHLQCRMECLADEDTAAVIQLDEQSRRWQEMMTLQSGNPDMFKGMMDGQQQVVFNAANPVVKALAKAYRDGRGDDEALLQVYDLARLAAGYLQPEEMAAFIRRSQSLLKKNTEV